MKLAGTADVGVIRGLKTKKKEGKDEHQCRQGQRGPPQCERERDEA